MIDPLTALATVKAGIAAGKQIHSLGKELSSFFETVDTAKKAHTNKKNSIFASANEEALATWTQNQNAKEAEAELREFIISVKGFSAYQDLLNLRRDIMRERKEAERLAAIEKEERRDFYVMCLIILLGVGAICTFIFTFLVYQGYIRP